MPYHIRARVEDGVAGRNGLPSVSRFKRARGMGVVGREGIPSVSLKERARGPGVAGSKRSPSVSHFERGRGMVVGWVEETPLRLTFRVREGWWWVVGRRRPPPSCSKHKGEGWRRVRWKRSFRLAFHAMEGDGVGSKDTAPFVSLETRGRRWWVGWKRPPPSRLKHKGMEIGGRRQPPPSRVSSEGGGLWWVGWKTPTSVSLF